MGFDANGSYTRIRGSDAWKGDAQIGTKIMAPLHDDNDNDLANALSDCLNRRGKGSALANINFGGFKLNNLGAPVAATDAATKGYIDTLSGWSTSKNITGTNANGRLNFTGGTGTNGITWTGVDLSWVSRMGTANQYRHRLVLNNKADATGGDVFGIDEGGYIHAPVLGYNIVHDGTNWRTPSPGYGVLTTLNGGNFTIYSLDAATTAAWQVAPIVQRAAFETPGLNLAGGVWTGNKTGPAMYSSSTNYVLEWYPNTYLGVSRTTFDMTMSLGGGIRAQWSASTGSFSNFGPAYKPGGGSWGDSSDERIKDVQGDYTEGLDAILALSPVRFTFKGNETFEQDAASPHKMAADNAQSFVGLIAQQVETILPDMVTQRAGFIDGKPVPDIRDLDTSNLIYVLVNAIKELAAKVEALEAK